MPILLAAKENNFENVEKALLTREDVNQKDLETGNTSLHFAAQNGNEKMVELLLAQSTINVNEENDEGETPLNLAVKLEDQEIGKNIVKLLLQHPGNMQTKNDTLLDSIAEGKRLLVQFLVEETHIDVNFTPHTPAGDPSYLRPLGMAICPLAKNYDYGIIDILIRKGANIDAVTSEGDSALSFALVEKNHNALERILKYLKETQQIEKINQLQNGYSYLTYAVRNCDPEAVKLFLENGADINIKNSDSSTVLGILFQYWSFPGMILNETTDEVNKKFMRILKLILAQKPNIEIVQECLVAWKNSFPSKKAIDLLQEAVNSQGKTEANKAFSQLHYPTHFKRRKEDEDKDNNNDKNDDREQKQAKTSDSPAETSFH